MNTEQTALLYTFLIIGFTIVLAAVIINWGTYFMHNVQNSEKESEIDNNDSFHNTTIIHNATTIRDSHISINANNFSIVHSNPRLLIRCYNDSYVDFVFPNMSVINMTLENFCLRLLQ